MKDRPGSTSWVRSASTAPSETPKGPVTRTRGTPTTVTFPLFVTSKLTVAGALPNGTAVAP